MRHDDQPVDLFVGIIGEREHRPIGAVLARAHLDAAHDAVRARRGRDLNAVALGLLYFGGGGKVDRRGVEPHVDGFDSARGRRQQCAGEREQGDGRKTFRDQSKSPGRACHSVQFHPAPFCRHNTPISRPGGR